MAVTSACCHGRMAMLCSAPTQCHSEPPKADRLRVSHPADPAEREASALEPGVARVLEAPGDTGYTARVASMVPTATLPRCAGGCGSRACSDFAEAGHDAGTLVHRALPPQASGWIRCCGGASDAPWARRALKPSSTTEPLRDSAQRVDRGASGGGQLCRGPPYVHGVLRLIAAELGVSPSDGLAEIVRALGSHPTTRQTGAERRTRPLSRTAGASRSAARSRVGDSSLSGTILAETKKDAHET
jgi:hypothetical protein